MRMKELVERTGVPRTTIHHYQREGLLPPARKTAANTAVYGPEHEERVRLVTALRGEELGPFAIDAIRSILAMIDRGIEPDVAASLHSIPGTPADAAISRLIAEVLADDALRPTDLEPVVELVRELVRYEHALLGFATTGLEGREAVARRNRLYRALHALHTHLYARMIVHDEPA
jgi:DNA-binding transcriptional MerR regulator